METLETIWSSRQTGEWFTSIDIPVQNPWSVRSSLGVHCSDQEVKLIALQKGIRITQYLEDWLVQARSQ